MREMKSRRWALDDSVRTTTPMRSTKPGDLNLFPLEQQESNEHPPLQHAACEPNDCAPPKPNRMKSGKHVTTRHRRRRSRSLNIIFSSSDEDVAPHKPRRMPSSRKLCQAEGKHQVGHRRTRSRSLVAYMDSIDFDFTAPKCEESRGKCPPPTMVKPTRSKRHSTDATNTQKMKKNHRRTRSKSLDLKFLNESNIIASTQNCDKSGVQCYPAPSWMGATLFENNASSDTPTEENNNNTATAAPRSRPRRRNANKNSSDSGRRSRSLDIKLDLPPCLPDRRQSREGKQPQDGLLTAENPIKASKQGDPQHSDMLIVPSFPQRQLMRRISSLTMDDSQCQPKRRISSLTIDSSLRTLVTDTAANSYDDPPAATLHEEEEEQDPSSPQETNIVSRTSLLEVKLLEETSKNGQGKESQFEFESSKAPLPTHPEVEPMLEKEPLPPPPPPPPSTSRSRYTPPSPLYFSGSPSSVVSELRYSRRKSKPRLSPFASSILQQQHARGSGASSFATGPKVRRRSESNKETPPPPITRQSPPVMNDSRHRVADSAMSPNAWLLEDRKSLKHENVVVLNNNKKQENVFIVKGAISKPQAQDGSSIRSRASYRPPLPLQSVSTFLMGRK